MRRSEKMLAAFPDLGREDLVQECMMRTLNTMHRFDELKGNLSTFVSNVVHRRLIDLWRNRSRRAQWEGRSAQSEEYAELFDKSDLDDEGEPIVAPEAVKELLAKSDYISDVDWLERMYAAAQHIFKSKRVRGGGRKWVRAAEAVAIALFMERESLTITEMERLLHARHDLMAVMGFLHVPHLSWFSRAVSFAEELQRKAALSRARRAKAQGDDRTGRAGH